MNGKLMNNMRLAAAVLVMVLLGTVLPASAAKKMVPKVDNFILFLDQSSSMKFTYKEKRQIDLGGQSKIVLAKSAMVEFNKLVPNLKYTSGVFTFAPFKQYGAVGPYNKTAVEKAIDPIDIYYDQYGRMTPMGLGLMDLDKTLAGLSGKTAVVLFTDGDDNLGMDAVAAAQQLQAKYGDKLCFMVVSFADNQHGQDQLRKIAALSPCHCIVEGDVFLRNQAAREAFLRCGFYDEIEDTESVVFRSIYFDFDKSNIKSEFIPVLDEGVAVAKSKGAARVVLEGHTDSVGSVAYNQALSERRANSVKNYFVKKGIDAGSITAVGYGKTRPRASNATAEGRKLNRRVEIKFAPMN